MNWAAAMYGVTYGLVAVHGNGECPSINQRTIRITVARLYNEHQRRRFNNDSHRCDPYDLKPARLYLEYKRKD